MTIERFDRARLRASPWKNGGGTTREIVVRPRGSGLETFAWRVSIADISADGSFSVFPGVDRIIMLLEGNGVLLRSDDGRLVHRLDEPLTPFAFSGDLSITASLLDGPSTDFNVMTRRAVARADVRVVRASETLPTSNAGVLFTLRGQWTVRTADEKTVNTATGQELQLPVGHGLSWDDERLAWHVAADTTNTPDAVLIAVHVHPSTDAA